jgi:hypothetical protein
MLPMAAARASSSRSLGAQLGYPRAGLHLGGQHRTLPLGPVAIEKPGVLRVAGQDAVLVIGAKQFAEQGRVATRFDGRALGQTLRKRFGPERALDENVHLQRGQAAEIHAGVAAFHPAPVGPANQQLGRAATTITTNVVSPRSARSRVSSSSESSSAR